MPNWTPAQTCAMELGGRDILVSAAAGSGKTATLTERIIRSLTETDENGNVRGDISRMLIVTFTRAAAAELRARISTALTKAIAEHPDNRYLYRQLVALGSAQICTIDAFYQQPVRANFERLGLPSSFRLADEAELLPLKRQVLDRLIDDHYAASAADGSLTEQPLSSIEGNAFAIAMDDLLPRRDEGDLSDHLLSLYEKLIAFPEGVELLKKNAERLCAQAELTFAETDEGKILIGALTEQLAHFRADLQECCDILKAHGQTATKYLPSFAYDLDCIDQLLASLSTGRWQEAGERLHAYAPLSLKPLSKKDLPPFDTEPLKQRRSEIVKQLRGLDGEYFSDGEAQMREQMLRTARTQRMLYVLLSDYERAIREQKNRRGVLDFSDVRRYLLELLIDKDGRPTDVARSLGERYDAIYIDEYQDVDTVQDTIFATIGQGGKRFMVGDIKQSIYSFRGAEPSIFSNYRRRFPTVSSPDTPPPENGSGNCVFMSENFRCDRSVIEFTNAVCGYAFEVCADTLAYRPEDDLICAKQPPSDDYRPTPVRLVLLEKIKGRQAPEAQKAAARPEAVYIADEIARLLREEKRADGKPFRPCDVAVLMRSATMAREIVAALRAHGIETSYGARDDLGTHPDMVLMVNLLSVIDNPHDDVPLMGLFAAATSPISLTDVFLARSASKKSASLYDDLCTAAESEAVAWSENTRHRVKAFLKKLDTWRTLAITLPIDRLLRRLYGEPFLSPIANSPALLCLYDYARNYQNSGFCGLYQFLRYFQQILKSGKALAAGGLQKTDDAVSIMTIHGSKGLEFPAVFLCNCAAAFHTDDTRAPLVFDAALGVAPRAYDPDSGQTEETVTRRAIAHTVTRRQTEEEMRLLYVALTRARERLYLTATLKSDAASRIDAANRPTRGKRYPIVSASSYLDWVLGALATPNRTGDTAYVNVEIKDKYDYLAPHPADFHACESEYETQRDPSDGAAFYRDILKQHENYIDPRAAVRYLPTKAAASKLRVAMLDSVWLPEEFGDGGEEVKPRTETPSSPADTAAYVRQRIALMQGGTPSFDERLRQEQSSSAAERGTATHLFLQHCDFSRLAKTSLPCEIERLVQSGTLPQRSARLLRTDHLEAFVQSELFALLTEPGATVWREQRFDRFLPYSRLTRNRDLAKRLEGYTLYVQGSLDVVIRQKDGTLWLCDYKTDRIHATDEIGIGRQLLSAHADQLRIYAEAAEGLFGRRVDHIAIYSLPLGRLIDLSEQLYENNENGG